MALWAVLFFAVSPIILYWSRQEMLEAPLTCMLLLATWLLLRYDEHSSFFRAALWAITLIAALMTKQHAIFILPAHGAYLLLRHGIRILRRPEIIVAVVAVGSCTIGYLVFSSQHSTLLMTNVVGAGQSEWMNWSRWLHYPSLIPTLMGWPITILVIVGAVLVLVDRKSWKAHLLYLCWAMLFYVMMLLLNARVTRYAYVWVPPLAVVAAFGIQFFMQRLNYRVVQIGISAALWVSLIPQVIAAKPPIVEGHEEAARFVATLDGGSSVLVDSVWDGDFVFFSRQHDRRKRIVLRGSKVLYTFASSKKYGFTSLVQSEDEIIELLLTYGVRYLVVETPDGERTEAGAMLRNMLNTNGRFRRLARVPINAEKAYQVGCDHLAIYEFPEAESCVANELTLRFPGLSIGEVTIPLPQHADRSRSKR